ncbi:hypothetical protein WDW37_12605 [Bdellovibrionota bacterium FG-1]
MRTYPVKKFSLPVTAAIAVLCFSGCLPMPDEQDPTVSGLSLSADTAGAVIAYNVTENQIVETRANRLQLEGYRLTEPTILQFPNVAVLAAGTTPGFLIEGSDGFLGVGWGFPPNVYSSTPTRPRQTPNNSFGTRTTPSTSFGSMVNHINGRAVIAAYNDLSQFIDLYDVDAPVADQAPRVVVRGWDPNKKEKIAAPVAVAANADAILAAATSLADPSMIFSVLTVGDVTQTTRISRKGMEQPTGMPTGVAKILAAWTDGKISRLIVSDDQGVWIWDSRKVIEAAKIENVFCVAGAFTQAGVAVLGEFAPSGVIVSMQTVPGEAPSASATLPISGAAMDGSECKLAIGGGHAHLAWTELNGDDNGDLSPQVQLRTIDSGGTAVFAKAWMVNKFSK